MRQAIKAGVVAAMKHEIDEVLKKSRREEVSDRSGRTHTFYLYKDFVFVISGPTKESAAMSTNVLVEKFAPGVLLSVGFAGSLEAAIGVPQLVVPKYVIDDASGKRFECFHGFGTLVTVDRVAGQIEKLRLAEQWGGLAVDMEASAVAEIAERIGCGFGAFKVISDDLKTDVGFVADFVTPQGFNTGSFLAHVAARPKLWPAVKRLKTNSDLAKLVLSESLLKVLNDSAGIESGLRAVLDSKGANVSCHTVR